MNMFPDEMLPFSLSTRIVVARQFTNYLSPYWLKETHKDAENEERAAIKPDDESEEQS